MQGLIAPCYSVGLVTEMSWVPSPVEAAGEFLSSGSAFCADSYFNICSTPRATTAIRKRPGDQSAESAAKHACAPSYYTSKVLYVMKLDVYIKE